MPLNNRDLVYAQFVKARALAIVAHARQTYGGEPYRVHLQAVVDVLTRFGCSLDDATAPCLIAAHLHDCIEDTSLTREDIEEGFGKQIGDIVWAVTDEPGLSRRERKPATYAKTAGSTIEAILVKLADRIANVENSIKFPGSGFLEMYRKEQPLFREALEPVSRTSEIAGAMWSHLEGLFNAKDGARNDR